MAVRKPRKNQVRTERDYPLPPLVGRSHAEAWADFDKRAQELLGISGEEFLRRFDRGDFSNQPEDERVVELGFMMVDPVR